MKIDTVYVPAGTYVLGDPCYVVPNDDWIKLLESCEYFKRPVGISGGYEVLAFGTKWGDGCYLDNKGREYPVDAGLIGLVPIAYADLTQTNGEHVIVEFKTMTPCIQKDNGKLMFGEVVIDTDPHEDEDY
jgi:hypothetical protein